MSSTSELPPLTPLEQHCLEFVRDMRRLGRMLSKSPKEPPPEAIELLRRIHGRRSQIAELRSASNAEAAVPTSGLIDLQASAEDVPPLLHKPPSRAMKWRGEVAQIQFAARAMARNLAAFIGLTDCLPIDSVVKTPTRLYTVEIKSTTRIQHGGWYVALHRSAHPDGSERYYRRDDFDVLAVMLPDDLWYLFPHSVIAGRRALVLPRDGKLRYSAVPNIEQYREAWHVFA
jgi:hypothetical protein